MQQRDAAQGWSAYRPLPCAAETQASALALRRFAHPLSDRLMLVQPGSGAKLSTSYVWLAIKESTWRAVLILFNLIFFQLWRPLHWPWVCWTMHWQNFSLIMCCFEFVYPSTSPASLKTVHCLKSCFAVTSIRASSARRSTVLLSAPTDIIYCFMAASQRQWLLFVQLTWYTIRVSWHSLVAA